jgi:hypothetical protein
VETLRKALASRVATRGIITVLDETPATLTPVDMPQGGIAPGPTQPEPFNPAAGGAETMPEPMPGGATPQPAPDWAATSVTILVGS